MSSSTLPTIPADRLALLDSAVLTSGVHSNRPGNCARELIHLIVTGEKADRTPNCLTRALSILPSLNDGPWRNDDHRTAVLMPYVRRLLECPSDEVADRSRTYALADYVVRTAAPKRAEAGGNGEWAARLRAVAPIVDHDTAVAALDVTRKLRKESWSVYYAADAYGAPVDATRATHATIAVVSAAAYAADAAAYAADAAAAAADDAAYVAAEADAAYLAVTYATTAAAAAADAAYAADAADADAAYAAYVAADADAAYLAATYATTAAAVAAAYAADGADGAADGAAVRKSLLIQEDAEDDKERLPPKEVAARLLERRAKTLLDIIVDPRHLTPVQPAAV